MAKLILLIALGVVSAYYFPDSRQAIENAAKPLMAPIVKWTATGEMAQVGQHVVQHEAFSGKLPDRRDWSGWLDWRYPVDDYKMDPWGSRYQLRVWADSVAIISLGPDRTRSTEDDFSVITPRPRRRR